MGLISEIACLSYTSKVAQHSITFLPYFDPVQMLTSIFNHPESLCPGYECEPETAFTLDQRGYVAMGLSKVQFKIIRTRAASGLELFTMSIQGFASTTPSRSTALRSHSLTKWWPSALSYPDPKQSSFVLCTHECHERHNRMTIACEFGMGAHDLAEDLPLPFV